MAIVPLLGNLLWRSFPEYGELSPVCLGVYWFPFQEHQYQDFWAQQEGLRPRRPALSCAEPQPYQVPGEQKENRWVQEPGHGQLEHPGPNSAWWCCLLRTRDGRQDVGDAIDDRWGQRVHNWISDEISQEMRDQIGHNENYNVLISSI